MIDSVYRLSMNYSIMLTEGSGMLLPHVQHRMRLFLMTATANPIHLMHIMNVHSIKTSHWQAATEEQLMILV